MSKFCAICGEELQDDATFCAKCGNEQPAEQTNEAADNNMQDEPAGGIAGKVNEFVAKVKNKDTKAIGILAGVAAVLVILLVVVFVFGGSSGPEKALDNYIDVTFYGKVNKIEKLAPKAYWDYMEDEYDVKVSDIEEQYEDAFDMMMELLEKEYGDDIKVKAKITDQDDVKKSVLDDMKDNLKEKYDIPKKSVKGALKLDVEMTIKGDDDDDTNDTTLYAINIDGDWYIVSKSGDFLMSSMF